MQPRSARFTPAQFTPARVPAGTAQRARRYLVETTSLPAAATPLDVSLTGRRIAIVGDGLGIALELAVLLEQRGAEVRLLGPDQIAQMTRTDALIYLAALDRGVGTRGAAGWVHHAARRCSAME